MSPRPMKMLRVLLPAWLVASGALSQESHPIGDSQEDVGLAAKVEIVRQAGMEDLPVLYDMVRTASAAYGLNTAQERSLVNEALNRIRQLGGGDLGLESMLERVANDPARDPGVREYALQHLYLWHSSSDKKSEVERVFWEMSDSSMYASISLLYLHRLESKGAFEKGDKLDASVLKAMGMPGLRDADKITLMAVASERGLKQGLPTMREWAGGTSWLVKVAATDSIGWLGDESDLQYLNEVVEIQNVREGKAALARAEKRMAMRREGSK
jgi:hypothetical protein